MYFLRSIGFFPSGIASVVFVFLFNIAVVIVIAVVDVISLFCAFSVYVCVNAVVSMVAALTSPSCCAYAETL